jgi:hypothetical protein
MSIASRFLDGECTVSLVASRVTWFGANQAPP